MKNAYTGISPKATPQRQPVPFRTDQIQNSEGGYVFEATKWDRFNRFLILGSEGGSYYVGEQDLTKQNLDNLMAVLAEDSKRAIDMIVDVSQRGRSFKNEPALFSLAVAASKGDSAARSYALEVLPKVARIPTHLFHFVQYAEQFRGWGRGMRNAVASWYNSSANLEYHLIKYQSRDGWSNADLLRLAHVYPANELQSQLFRWAVGKEANLEGLPLIQAFEAVKRTKDKNEVIRLIREHRLPRECIPTEWLNDPDVWAALLEEMPMTAMIRNLGKLTNVGLISPFSSATTGIVETLINADRLKAARIHPMAVLIAMLTYEQGHGEKGSLHWTPVPKVVEALDSAFYLSFANVEPTGKKLLLGIDVSGSMSAGVMGLPLACAKAAAAQALITLRTEPNSIAMKFDTGSYDVSISPHERLDDVVRKIGSGGGTDCSQPILYAAAKKWTLDGIVMLTDMETWAGNIQVFQALQAYREKFNPNARMISVAMESNQIQLQEPKDNLSLNVAGFDASVPVIISQFLSGKL